MIETDNIVSDIGHDGEIKLLPKNPAFYGVWSIQLDCVS